MIIEPPQIYADWVKCFELLKEEDQDEEEILKAIGQGTIQWVPGVSERFVRLLNEVIEDRFFKSARKLKTDLERARTQEHLLVPALIAERKRCEFLVRLVMKLAIPREQKKRFLEAIAGANRELQQNLESSARKSDPSGELFHIVNRNPVLVEIPELPPEETKAPTSFFTSLVQAIKKK